MRSDNRRRIENKGGSKGCARAAKQSKVCLNFLVINILLPLKGAKWSIFNDQKLDNNAVRKLVEGFKVDLENCTNKMVIEATMQKRWLKNGMMDKFHGSVKGLRIQDVHKLELNKQSEKEMKAELLWMLRGNHRQAALEIFIKDKMDKIKKAKKDIAKAKMRGGAMRVRSLWQPQSRRSKMRQRKQVYGL